MPRLASFGVIDYLYEFVYDGNSKFDRRSGNARAVFVKASAVWNRLMDSWYANYSFDGSNWGIRQGSLLPLKTNRLVEDSGGDGAYKRIDQLNWNALKQQGKLISV